MADEKEIHMHRGAPAERSNGKFCIPDDDNQPHVSQYDDEALWTLDVYHAHHQRTLAKLGAQPLPATHSAGSLYRLTAQQLIEFVAADAGLNVEFRKRKKRQLSDEQKAELGERMRRINSQRNGAVI